MLEHGMCILNSREENFCENIFASLIEILKKEIVVYQELKKTIVHERIILKKPTLDELNHNNSIKENMILKGRMLEEARISIVKKIAVNLDLDPKGLKLSQIADYAGTEQRLEIRKLRDAITAIARELNELNTVNKNLLNASIGNIKSSLDFINSLMSSQSVYLECGKMKTVTRNGAFLHKEG